MTRLDKRLICAGGLIIWMLVSCQRGYTEITGFVEGEFTYLTSPVSGTLKWLGVSRGEQVTENQLLYRLDGEPEQSELDAAKQRTVAAVGQSKDLAAPARATQLGVIEGQLNEAKAAAALNKVRLQRMQSLYNKKFIPLDSLDSAKSDFNSATAKVASLQSQLNDAKLGGREHAVAAAYATAAANAADLKRAEWTLGQKSGFAVGAGTVFDTFYRIGEYVPAGRPVLALLLPKDIHIVFYLSADRMKSIRLGSEIELQCSGCRDDLVAKVDYISPVAEFTPPVIYSLENGPKLAFRILAHPNRLEGLHPGQPVTIRITKHDYDSNK